MSQARSCQCRCWQYYYDRRVFAVQCRSGTCGKLENLDYEGKDLEEAPVSLDPDNNGPALILGKEKEERGEQ